MPQSIMVTVKYVLIVGLFRNKWNLTNYPYIWNFYQNLTMLRGWADYLAASGNKSCRFCTWKLYYWFISGRQDLQVIISSSSDRYPLGKSERTCREQINYLFIWNKWIISHNQMPQMFIITLKYVLIVGSFWSRRNWSIYWSIQSYFNKAHNPARIIRRSLATIVATFPICVAHPQATNRCCTHTTYYRWNHIFLYLLWCSCHILCDW